MRKDSILQNYYYNKLPKQKPGGEPLVSKQGYKQGLPPQGSYYRIPSDTLYNPTPYTIKATANTGQTKILKPFDKNNVTFPNASYVDEYHLENGGLIKYQEAGPVRTRSQAWGDLFNKALPFISPVMWAASKILPNKKNVESAPVQTASVQQQPEFIDIKDPRKIRMTTGQPMVPTRDLVGAKYPLTGVKSLLQQAKDRGISKEDAWNLATIAFQESKWGKTDENLGHTLHGNENLSAEENLINAYLGKMKEAEGYGIKDPLKKLQIYNGSMVKPETEKGYHGFVAKAFYGVPVPKEGIDLRKNPLYGKQITDLRENVLKQNPEFVNIFNSYYKAYGGPLVDYYAGKMNHGEMFKEGGSVREKAIYPSGTRQPLSLNAVMSQNRMDRDNNSYSGGISKFAEGGSTEDCPCPEFNCDCPPGYGTASRGDSIDVRNSAIANMKWIQKHPEYRQVTDPKSIKQIKSTNTFADPTKPYLQQLEQSNKNIQTEPKKKENYRKVIDKNKFKQREISFGTLNPKIPPTLYDKRIQPQDMIIIEGSPKASDVYPDNPDLKGTNIKAYDVVQIPQYDPIAVTPWDMLTPKEQEIRIQKYGTQGTPYAIPNTSSSGINTVTNINSQVSSVQPPPIQKPSVQQNPSTVAWNVEYFDPTLKKTTTKTFATDKEAEDFYNNPANQASRKYSDVSGVGRFAKGGSLLSRTVTCSNCGWSWKGVDGGSDPMTCHKCGGDIKMKEGGVASNKGYYNKGYGVPQFPVGGMLQSTPPVNRFGYVKANGGDISIPQLPSSKGPLLQFYYNNI